MFMGLRLLFFCAYMLSGVLFADDRESEGHVLAKNAMLVLDADAQLLMGLQTTVLAPYLLQPKQKIVAIQIDVSELTRLQLAYQEAAHTIALLQILLDQQRVTIKRLTLLKQSKVLAARRLLLEQSQFRQTQLKLKYAKQKQQYLIVNVKRQWGTVLSRWLLAENHPNFQRLLAGQQALYRLYLPENISVPPPLIQLFSVAAPEKKYSARWLSYAPVQNFKRALGRGAFYLGEHKASAPAARLLAEVAVSTEKRLGLRIPRGAVIWHLGQACVYLQDEKTWFKRVPLTQGQWLNDKDYFMPFGLLKQGDRLVSLGAQMLLSEEFKGQIQTEEEADD